MFTCIFLFTSWNSTIYYQNFKFQLLHTFLLSCITYNSSYIHSNFYRLQKLFPWLQITKVTPMITYYNSYSFDYRLQSLFMWLQITIVIHINTDYNSYSHYYRVQFTIDFPIFTVYNSVPPLQITIDFPIITDYNSFSQNYR